MSGDKKSNKPEPPAETAPPGEMRGLTRRAVLSKAGKVAWAAPALVMLCFPGQQANATDCGPGVPEVFCPPGTPTLGTS